jgi:hypothetical protein
MLMELAVVRDLQQMRLPATPEELALSSAHEGR